MTTFLFCFVWLCIPCTITCLHYSALTVASNLVISFVKKHSHINLMANTTFCIKFPHHTFFSQWIFSHLAVSLSFSACRNASMGLLFVCRSRGLHPINPDPNPSHPPRFAPGQPKKLFKQRHSLKFIHQC